MRIDLSGRWKLRLDPENTGEREDWGAAWGEEEQTLMIPGCLQGQGYGNPITKETPWVSGLHDPLWYEREEYKAGAESEEVKVPFLSQPPRHYIGKAWYQRTIRVEKEEAEAKMWSLWIELTHWVSQAWLDGKEMGEDFSLCAAHEIDLGSLDAGEHVLTVCIDNSFRWPYRPDGHGVSDALGATWNGMAGQVMLMDEKERNARREARVQYSREHPVKILVKDGAFYVNDKKEYFRGTHFGGEYPLTGYPSTDVDWWKNIMETIQRWGLNFIRFHSMCPPDAAFCAADELGVYLQVECGMWNHFEEGIPMLEILRGETERILRQFGHHPSFVLFSPSNEPGGEWYEPLKNWVTETRLFDESLGYAQRRVYTAESGWFYKEAPKDVTGTDYMYFHRSAYGPYLGGNIRNEEGWKGRDYEPSLEGCRLPVISHELGQWCAYPDFSVKERFKGYLKPGNYEVFQKLAEKRGVLDRNKEFAWCSGKNQVMMYKEDLEATARTPCIYGFELLDLHDYLGQGTAVVGVLDAFWQEKGYVKPEEWREFCSEKILLARISSYVVKNTEKRKIPVELCYFGTEVLREQEIVWHLKERGKIKKEGSFLLPEIRPGKNIPVGKISLDFSEFQEHTCLELELLWADQRNHWELHLYAAREEAQENGRVLYTRNWEEAERALEEGKRVVFCPYLTALNYNCPPLSLKPVFWNSQMGPNWMRGAGMVCRENHPVFAGFPTEKWGGWQWEDIFSSARAMDVSGFPREICHMAEPIDDWNRSLPLSLLFECRMKRGKLLVVSACLEGTFEARPAAFCLKQSILHYAASEKFCPQTELEPEKIRELLFPNNGMVELGVRVGWNPEAAVRNPNALTDGNPNTEFTMEADSYPMRVSYEWDRPVMVSGLVYMAGQRDRKHEGDVKGYRVLIRRDGTWMEVLEGELLSTVLPQKLKFSQSYPITGLCFEILSGFEPEVVDVWSEEADGWHLRRKKVCHAVFSILSLETREACQGSDSVPWKKPVRSKTKEIDD